MIPNYIAVPILVLLFAIIALCLLIIALNAAELVIKLRAYRRK